MQVQTTWLEGRIRDEFDKLRDFLRVEEQATLDAMKEESRKKHLQAEEKMKHLAEQTEALAREIERLQMEMKEDDMTFLMVRGSVSDLRGGQARASSSEHQPHSAGFLWCCQDLVGMACAGATLAALNSLLPHRCSSRTLASLCLVGGFSLSTPK